MLDAMFPTAFAMLTNIDPLIKLAVCVTITPILLVVAGQLAAIKACDDTPIMGTYRRRTVR